MCLARTTPPKAQNVHLTASDVLLAVLVFMPVLGGSTERTTTPKAQNVPLMASGFRWLFWLLWLC